MVKAGKLIPAQREETLRFMDLVGGLDDVISSLAPAKVEPHLGRDRL